MKVQTASDLHLELEENSDYVRDFPLIPCGDILILSGDIGYLGHYTYEEHPFWDWASECYERVLVVLGNKEFYRGYDVGKLKNGTKNSIWENIHWFYNKSEVIRDVEFLMTPLWSFIPVSAEAFVKKAHPDFRFIRYNEEFLSIDIYNKLHNQCIEFLMGELPEKKGKRIIVSHHAPSFKCMTEEFNGNLINCAFYSDMEKLIKLYNPDYWVYGHSHRNICDLKIGETIVLSNQLGYVSKSEQYNFNRSSYFII